MTRIPDKRDSKGELQIEVNLLAKEDMIVIDFGRSTSQITISRLRADALGKELIFYASRLHLLEEEEDWPGDPGGDWRDGQDGEMGARG